MKRVRGFTLIEILVALAVVGMGLAALITASGRSTRNAAELRDRTYANWVARNVLTEIRLEQEALGTATRRGEEELGGETWAWEAEIREAGIPVLDQILVRVGRPGADGSIVTISGFRLTEPQAVLRQAPREEEQE